MGQNAENQTIGHTGSSEFLNYFKRISEDTYDWWGAPFKLKTQVVESANDSLKFSFKGARPGL